MNFLKKNYLWVILIFSLILYFVVISKKPCDSPIKYRIGTFDSRFGISQADFQSDIDKAVAIWQKPIDKKLFIYDSKANLTINLIYDTRQKNTQEVQVLTADINKTNNLAQSIKQQYTSLKSEYSASLGQYNDMLRKLNQDEVAYSSQVEYWNSRGGAPQSEFNKLMVMKSNLATEQSGLENKRIEVNDLSTQINNFIDKYNLLVQNENSNVSKINQTAGKEFDEGIYSPSNNEIDIYQFTDNQKLIRVLTHELGHALGLGHNDNPQSIMYAVNQSVTLSLSSDDIKDLKTVCKLP